MTSATHDGTVRLPRTSGRSQAATDHLVVAGFLFIILGGAFLTVTMLAASIAPAYDFNGGAISDLGVIDETAVIFNALLLLTGALNAVGGYLLYTSHRRRWLLSVYLVAAIGALGAGLMPLDTGGAHSIFALLGFVFFNLEAVGTAATTRGPMRVISVAAGAAGLAFVGVMIVGDGGNPAIFGPIGHGGAERMIVYPAMLWLLVFGGYLMGHDERVPGTGRTTLG